MNKVMLVGNLGADAEMRTTPAGRVVVSFRMATTDIWTDKSGQRQERTEWHRVAVWGSHGEACGQYLRKGRSVHVEGKLRTHSWEDQTSKQKRYSTEVVADRVTFLDDPGGAGDRPREDGAEES